MSKIISAVKSFAANQKGVTAIEYGLIAAVLALVLVVGLGAFGTKLSASFIFVANLMKSA